MTESNTILQRRFWLLENLEFIINESNYYKDNRPHFMGDPITVWKFDVEETATKIE